MLSEPTQQSQSWSLNAYDLRRWFRNLIIFSIPALAVIQTNLVVDGVVNWQLAAGMGIQALTASVIDLGKKFGGSGN